MLYRETRGSGKDLVLLHGWGMSSAVWGDLANELTANYRVTLLELPGHGSSPLAPGAKSLQDWAHACLAVAPERASWLGWSLGGLVGMQVALLAPERVETLVMVPLYFPSRAKGLITRPQKLPV